MRRALVAIGVNKTASAFPALKAAALGAKQIYDWAKRQGFDSVLLTDEASKVRHADVYEAVDAFVQKGVAMAFLWRQTAKRGFYPGRLTTRTRLSTSPGRSRMHVRVVLTT
jgi:hypothetical protein